MTPEEEIAHCRQAVAHAREDHYRAQEKALAKAQEWHFAQQRVLNAEKDLVRHEKALAAAERRVGRAQLPAIASPRLQPDTPPPPKRSGQPRRKKPGPEPQHRTEPKPGTLIRRVYDVVQAGPPNGLTSKQVHARLSGDQYHSISGTLSRHSGQWWRKDGDRYTPLARPLL